MGPLQPNHDDPGRARSLHDARLAAQVAQALASPALASALTYLKLVADNMLLPDTLRVRAREAALRVAEAAVHLEYLPEIIDIEERDT